MYGVICSEWVPFEPASRDSRAGAIGFPGLSAKRFVAATGLSFMTEDCAVWDVPQALASVRQVTVSTIPTLVLNASFDGKSAPQWGIYAASTLQNSTTVTVPGSGHGALFGIQMPADAPARACTQSSRGVVSREPGAARHKLRGFVDGAAVRNSVMPARVAAQ